jgi:hypothetical protein
MFWRRPGRREQPLHDLGVQWRQPADDFEEATIGGVGIAGHRTRQKAGEQFLYLRLVLFRRFLEPRNRVALRDLRAVDLQPQRRAFLVHLHL